MTDKKRHAAPEKTFAQTRPDDEIVHVPRSSSRWRFILTLVAVIFVLVIFTVGDQLIQSVGGSGQAGKVYMSWRHPEKGLVEYSYPEFVGAKRQLENFYRVQGQRVSREALSDANVAYLLVTDALAQRAGIEVTDRELARTILEGERGRLSPFFTPEVYEQRLAAQGVSSSEFEAMLRSILRVTRYENLLGASLGLPDPKSIEEQWKQRHQERAFEAVSVAAADFDEAARAELPDEAQLASWYEGLPDRRQLFADRMLPERLAAELIGWRPDGAQDAAALLEAYPPPEGSEPQALAQTYYDTFAHVRFARPEPLPESPDGGDVRSRLYLPFEEVAEQAEREARIHDALRRLMEDLRAQQAAGTELELQARAEALDLFHERVDDPLPQTAWARNKAEDETAAASVGGPFLSAGLMQAGADGLTRSTIVARDGLFLGRVLQRLPAGPPPFADVREEVADLWLERRALELARARLTGLHEVLVPPGSPQGGPKVSAEAFAQAAQEAGLEVVRQEHFDFSEAEPDGDEEREPLLAMLVDAFRSGGPVFGLEEGQVAAPQAGPQGERLWLVRSAGTRDPAEVRIEPADYETLRSFAVFSGFEQLREHVLNPRAYARRYELRLEGAEPQEEGEGGGPDGAS